MPDIHPQSGDLVTFDDLPVATVFDHPDPETVWVARGARLIDIARDALTLVPSNNDIHTWALSVPVHLADTTSHRHEELHEPDNH